MDLSEEFVQAVGAGVLIGVLLTSVATAAVGALTGGGTDANQMAGATIHVGGEVRGVNATNETLLIDTPDSPTDTTALDISGTGPLDCTTDGQLSCQPGTSWRSIEPGSPVCAAVGIPETGAPVAQNVFVNATCSATGLE